jgi:hypothetical protein
VTVVQYSTHLHTNNTQDDTKKQNTLNRTYITIKINIKEINISIAITEGKMSLRCPGSRWAVKTLAALS